jgi:hypothetical protein
LAVFAAGTSCVKTVPQEQPENTPPPKEVKNAPPPNVPGLIIHVEPPDAELIIDGVNHGMASRVETDHGVVALKSGIYQVSFKRTGYISWRAEVTVNDKPEKIEVTLLHQ